jgi:hypothetical protein
MSAPTPEPTVQTICVSLSEIMGQLEAPIVTVIAEVLCPKFAPLIVTFPPAVLDSETDVMTGAA